MEQIVKIWTSVQASHITARDRLFAITRTAASTAFAWQDIAIMVPIAGTLTNAVNKHITVMRCTVSAPIRRLSSYALVHWVLKETELIALL